ncbi:MAG: DUF2213 domain-containing protein, partial [Deltaproteobacteria bacterium]|nr:DUF2213 domain-containing protein [Candidatus Anaeroferrophillacea bacterium]
MNVLQFVGNRIDGATLWRREAWEGREYLVAPVVAIRAGVLNKELVPAEEIAAGFGSWNGRPVTIDHPVVDGAFVSANHPLLLSQCQVGQVFNARVDDDALKAEMWIDVARAGRIEAGQELLRRVEDEEPIEVSTAYFRALEDLAGELAGMAFEFVAHDLKPDHLAVLLNAKGACSWERGCGVPRVNEGDGEATVEEVDMQVNILSEARTPAYEGTEEIPWADVVKTFEAYRDGYYQHSGEEKPEDVPATVGDAPAAMRSWIAGKSLLGDPDADDVRGLTFFPVVNPDTNKLNAGAVRAVLGGRAAQADIPEGALESAQSVARRLLEDEFGGEPAGNADPEQTETVSPVQRAWRALGKALGFLPAVQQDVVEPGGPEMCVCPECGHEAAKVRGVPCRSMECPECGAMMIA